MCAMFLSTVSARVTKCLSFVNLAHLIQSVRWSAAMYASSSS